jgi:hypothetical protein
MMRLKVRADDWRTIWHPSVSRPEHSGSPLAHLRQHIDGMEDIPITDITKDTTDQDDVSWDRSHIRRELRGVTADDLDLAETGLVGKRPSGGDIALVKFDQTCSYTPGMRIDSQYLKHIYPLTRTQTDELQRSVEFRWEGFLELRLDHR